MKTPRTSRNFQQRPAFALFLLLIGGAGCFQPHPATLPPDVQIQFRAAAIEFIQAAAFAEDPTHRMHAIEAVQEVAPTEGLDLQGISRNIDDVHPGVRFAALMAAGEIRAKQWISKIRTRCESANPHVKMAALYALHRLGDKRRTGDLAHLLLENPDARVRANAAMVIGRLGGKEHIHILKIALRQEKKNAPKLQILESLAALGDQHATERLLFDGYSAIPQQSMVALMMLAEAKAPSAVDLFRLRLQDTKHPELQMQAARGLALQGDDRGLEIAIQRLFFSAPRLGFNEEPAGIQIDRVRGLAALALEAMPNPASLGPLKQAFEKKGQSPYVRLAIARAAVHTIDQIHRMAGGEHSSDETLQVNRSRLVGGATDRSK